MKATWTAKLDAADSTAPGGYRREVLVKGKVTRAEADAAVSAAVGKHVAETGHAPSRPLRFPGKTHVSCPCGVAFHATGLREG